MIVNLQYLTPLFNARQATLLKRVISTKSRDERMLQQRAKELALRKAEIKVREYKAMLVLVLVVLSLLTILLLLLSSQSIYVVGSVCSIKAGDKAKAFIDSATGQKKFMDEAIASAVVEMEMVRKKEVIDEALKEFKLNMDIKVGHHFAKCDTAVQRSLVHSVH